MNNSVLDLGVMLAMGVTGYVRRKFGLNPATLILPLVIGTVMEQALAWPWLLRSIRRGARGRSR